MGAEGRVLDYSKLLRVLRGKALRVAFLGAWLLVLPGCQIFQPKPLKPWDRNILALPEMRPDAYPMESLLDQKIYFSKEASSGGASVGGGGCGCN